MKLAVFLPAILDRKLLPKRFGYFNQKVRYLVQFLNISHTYRK